MNQLFDFSNVQVGDKLTRIIYNLWTNEALVTGLNEQEIQCSVLVDRIRNMTFNRETGVHTEDLKFGLIVNRSGQGKEFVEQLKRDLHKYLDEGIDLNPDTVEALREQLAKDW